MKDMDELALDQIFKNSCEYIASGNYRGNLFALDQMTKIFVRKHGKELGPIFPDAD